MLSFGQKQIETIFQQKLKDNLGMFCKKLTDDVIVCRSVYPVEQIIAADRRPFHPQCIKCQMQGCGNDLTARGLHKYEGYNICDRCHEMIFINKTYGPAEGMETAEERKRREEEERLARERAEKAKRDRLCPECSKKVRQLSFTSSLLRTNINLMMIVSDI